MPETGGARVEGPRSAPSVERHVIELTRLGAHGEPVWVNPDLIATMEAHPDTVVVLTTGTKLVVADSVEDVVQAVRDWRVSVARGALKPGEAAPTTRSG